MTPNLIEAMARAIDTAGVIAGATGHRLTAQRVLTAISESGYAVVPREPTEAMIRAGIIERHDQQTPEAWNLATANIFRAMINAGTTEEN